MRSLMLALALAGSIAAGTAAHATVGSTDPSLSRPDVTGGQTPCPAPISGASRLNFERTLVHNVSAPPSSKCSYL